MFSQRIIAFRIRFLNTNISRNYHNVKCLNTVLRTPLGNSACVQGWVKNLRLQKDNVFVDVNDGTTTSHLQVVIPKSIKPDGLSYGCSVHISGVMNEGPRGQKELHADHVKVIGECVVVNGYPFNPRTVHPPDYTRQFLHLRPRTNYISAVLRIRNTMTMAIHNFFQSQNYLNVNTPILTSYDCEGDCEVFKVSPESQKLLESMKQGDENDDTVYFGGKTFLTVSGQLQLEALCRAMGNVYTLGPTFRAENSKSRLHLSEFYMLEAELAFCSQLSQLQSVIEDLIKHSLREILDQREEDLYILRGKDDNIKTWLDSEFKTVTYKEAQEILRKIGAVSKIEGINKEQELKLVEHCGGMPVFVVEWPKHMKSFYMKETCGDNSLVDALDLLAPVTGEIVGGSLRQDDYNKLKQVLLSEDLNWYLELRKFGNIPTGGFGLGMDRLLQVFSNVSNIKDTLPFPRCPHNCTT